MANRPVFIPVFSKEPMVRVEDVTFTWHPGLSLQQKQRNVAALHQALIEKHSEMRPLEISSKSTVPLGVQLSAFNLGTTTPHGRRVCVESLYQASKVFENGEGPFPEYYGKEPRDVRKKIQSIKGHLVRFQYGQEAWPLLPTRAFYDWVYCKMLSLNPTLLEELRGYNAFTDIEFNPQKSVNCQAYAVALYLALDQAGVLEEALSSQEAFLKFHPQQQVLLSKPKKRSMKRQDLADVCGGLLWRDKV